MNVDEWQVVATIDRLLLQSHRSERSVNEYSLKVGHYLLPEIRLIQFRKFGKEPFYDLLNLLVELLLSRWPMTF